MKYIIAVDQSTSATKAILFNEQCQLIGRKNVAHKQYYPQAGWVEHDPEEIYNNTVKAIHEVLQLVKGDNVAYSLALTNQRETVVVWNRHTGKPVYNAVVWQCQRGADICRDLVEKGYTQLIRERTGLLIDPYFAASGVKWILDNVEGAKEDAQKGDLLRFLHFFQLFFYFLFH